MKDSERVFYWTQYEQCKEQGKTVTMIPVSGLGALLHEPREQVDEARQTMFEDVIAAAYGGRPKRPARYTYRLWIALLEQIGSYRRCVRRGS